MNDTLKQLLLDAAEALQSACYFKYQKYTQFSCTDRNTWSYEQECRYGSEEDYELSLKLIALTEEGTHDRNRRQRP